MSGAGRDKGISGAGVVWLRGQRPAS
jgi:hypothetical protein